MWAASFDMHNVHLENGRVEPGSHTESNLGPAIPSADQLAPWEHTVVCLTRLTCGLVSLMPRAHHRIKLRPVHGRAPAPTATHCHHRHTPFQPDDGALHGLIVHACMQLMRSVDRSFTARSVAAITGTDAEAFYDLKRGHKMAAYTGGVPAMLEQGWAPESGTLTKADAEAAGAKVPSDLWVGAPLLSNMK